MTYPMDGLAVIAPILFMVMIIGFPLIGLAVGWKRALYWGGGNFLFYVIGLIVWKCAGGAIGSSIAGLLKSMIPALKDLDPTKLATSVAGPVFFIIILLVANLILLINYYAWFKKVAGIKKDIAAKKALKAAKKQYKEKGKKVPEVLTATTKDGTKVTQKSYGLRAGHRLIGLASMEILMLPVTLSLTNAVFFTTTNTTTRSKNGFANGLYESLSKTDHNMSWFSYYGGTSGDDFDALLTALALSSDSTKIEYSYYDYEKGETVTESNTLSELVTNKIPNSVSDMSKNIGNLTASTIEETFNSTTGTEEQKVEAVNSELQKYINPVNTLANQWNALVKTYPTEAAVLLGSSNIMDLVMQMLNHQDEETSKFTISKSTLDKIFGTDRKTGTYFTIRDQYIEAAKKGDKSLTVEIEQEISGTKYTFEFSMYTINELAVKASTITNIKDVAYSFIEFDSTVSDTDKTFFDARIDELIALLLEQK